jgi:hypothetical protein
MGLIEDRLAELERQKWPHPRPHNWIALPAWSGGRECEACGCWRSAMRAPESESICQVLSDKAAKEAEHAR